jgi:hypothetical protein
MCMEEIRHVLRCLKAIQSDRQIVPLLKLHTYKSSTTALTRAIVVFEKLIALISLINGDSAKNLSKRRLTIGSINHRCMYDTHQL